jgi:hypothetical protein
MTTFGTRKAAELLLILAVNPNQVLSRRDIVSMLWPGGQGSKAANRLSATIYMLRKNLESEFGAEAATLISSGEGSLWLGGDFEIDLMKAEAAWRAMQSSVLPEERVTAARRLCDLYAGHLGSDLNGAWFEPIQSLWASRWTEATIALAQDSGVVDDAVSRAAQMRPILPVTATMIGQFLRTSNREDLAHSWRTQSEKIEPALRDNSVRQYRSYADEDLRTISKRPTMTALVVEPSHAMLLGSFVEELGLSEGLRHPQIFCARNPVLARRIAARIRNREPLARMYLSTEIVDLQTTDDTRLLSWITLIEPGETLVNQAAASLINHHDSSVIIERQIGRAEYRLY